MLTIYSTPLSANGRKVLAVSRELKLDAVIRLINVYRGEGRSADYLAINPTGKIPTLVDGDLILYESNAILPYLCEAHGNYCLWSRDLQARARIMRWLFWESAHWQPTLTQILSSCVGHRLLPKVVPHPGADPDWGAAELQGLLKVITTTLDSSAFLAGDHLTIADFAVAGMVTYFPVAGFRFESHLRFRDWYRCIEATDGWRATQDPLWAV